MKTVYIALALFVAYAYAQTSADPAAAAAAATQPEEKLALSKTEIQFFNTLGTTVAQLNDRINLYFAMFFLLIILTLVTVAMLFWVTSRRLQSFSVQYETLLHSTDKVESAKDK